MLGRKILGRKATTLGLYSQSSGFSSSRAWTWELDYKESWAPKNWCFWTVVWRRLGRLPWTARRSNQSILKEINSEYSLEGLMLNLKLQYFGLSLGKEKNLTVGKTEGRRRRGWQRMRWLDGITDSMEWVCVDSGSWWWTGKPGVLRFMGLQRVRHYWVTELNWTQSHYPAVSSSELTTNWNCFVFLITSCLLSLDKFHQKRDFILFTVYILQ